MDLAFVVYGSLDERSGGFRYDRRLVDQLRDRGHDVDVVSLPWSSYPAALTHNLGTGLPSRLSGFDAVLEDELCHPSLVGVNRRVDAPVVSVVHHLRSSEPGPRWRTVAYRAVERRYLRNVDAAVCNGETTRATVASLADLPTVVAPPAGDRFVSLGDPAEMAAPSTDGGDAGADATAAVRPPGPDEPLHLLSLGNLEPRKGTHVLLDGLARVDADWELTVVGGVADPEYARRMRRRVAELDLGDRVTFAGRLPDDAVADRLAESHLLAVPSLYEGLGLVYLEAMAFGVPALATTAGGASEVVTDGENGVLVPPDDPAAVADAVRSLRDHPARLAEMSVAARVRFAAQPGWDDAAADVESLLAAVVPP
ncbi:glycosyltransferase family 4 protein [Halomicrococcus gelatinilyticus]|uniref:glycosyltransferase family 4 protein n=1 Tax=Halomicrococcus gelatinilyticus TaxID=1702103 RepID=UPI002E114057